MELYFCNARRAIHTHILWPNAGSLSLTPVTMQLPEHRRAVNVPRCDQDGCRSFNSRYYPPFLASIRRRVYPCDERKCSYVTAKFLLLRHRKLNNAIDWQGSLLLIHLFYVWCARVCVCVCVCVCVYDVRLSSVRQFRSTRFVLYGTQRTQSYVNNFMKLLGLCSAVVTMCTTCFTLSD